ncbi:MAG: hypothetical protein NTV68_01400 [Methanomicrobiales archaeon]|nr:hypothetical protein [Methanomicrobiales archaeon]
MPGLSYVFELMHWTSFIRRQPGCPLRCFVTIVPGSLSEGRWRRQISRRPPSPLLRYLYQCPWYDTGSSMSIPYLPAVINGATGPRVKDLTVRQNPPPGVSPASGQVTPGSFLLPPRKS